MRKKLTSRSGHL